MLHCAVLLEVKFLTCHDEEVKGEEREKID